MQKVEYRLSSDPGDKNIVFRRVTGDGEHKCEVWLAHKNEWADDPDAYGAFVGFYSSKPISEGEAKNIIGADAF